MTALHTREHWERYRIAAEFVADAAPLSIEKVEAVAEFVRTDLMCLAKLLVKKGVLQEQELAKELADAMERRANMFSNGELGQ